MAKEWIVKKPDGTVKQFNPFTGLEVWTVTGRGFKPFRNQVYNEEQDEGEAEAHCDFCETRYLNTPPEKSRLVIKEDTYEIKRGLLLENIQQETADFRRIGNLFEIVSYDYWVHNHKFHPVQTINAWKEEYLKSPGGLEHVLNMLDYKLTLGGRQPEELKKIPLTEKLEMANAFFAGGHELIIARRHYIDSGNKTRTPCSSGELTSSEHYYYTQFTVDTIKEMYNANRYVRYVSVFQNWLKPAGASFDHLHKQLVAIDEWGVSIERELRLMRANPNIYNLCAVNYAGYKNLIVAENDYAVAFADFGHRYPTLAVYCKSEKGGPFDLRPDEIRGMSDIVHACHAAATSALPANEEWYYSPLDAIEVMPWHILIKWRINTPAGFEGGTKIYINTLDPEGLRDKLVPNLLKLRAEGKIAPMKIADECLTRPNALKYYLRYIRL